MKNRLLSVQLVLFICLTPFGALLADPVPVSPGLESFADRLYLQGEYQLAELEYRKARRGLKRKKQSTGTIDAKLSLSLMRQRKYSRSLEHINTGTDFSARYLRLFAYLKTGSKRRALKERRKLKESGNLSERQKNQVELMAGTMLIEERRFQSARSFYRNLRKEDINPDIRRISTGVLLAMETFEKKPRKSALLAGLMSTVLPGSGQFYARHEADGVMALFFNTIFLGSSAALYSLENRAGSGHGGSIAVGIVGLFFYAINIVGAIAAAKRYNLYQERVFHQQIRDKYFNLDYVEKASGIKFQVQF